MGVRPQRLIFRGIPTMNTTRECVTYILLTVRPKVDSAVDAMCGLGLKAGAVFSVITSFETVVT